MFFVSISILQFTFVIVCTNSPTIALKILTRNMYNKIMFATLLYTIILPHSLIFYSSHLQVFFVRRLKISFTINPIRLENIVVFQKYFELSFLSKESSYSKSIVTHTICVTLKHHQNHRVIYFYFFSTNMGCISFHTKQKRREEELT